MSNILKYEDAFLEFKTDTSKPLSQDMQEALAELDRFGDQMNEIALDFETLGVAIAKFRGNCENISEQLQNLATHTLSSFIPDGDFISPFLSDTRNESGRRAQRNAIYGAGALVGAGLLLEGVGWVREQIALKQQRRRMRELLVKKQELAAAKLPPLEQAYKKLRLITLSKIEQGYEREFNKDVELSDSLAVGKAVVFSMVFVSAMRLRYLVALADYSIKEMQAWLAGEHESGIERTDLVDILLQEFATWPLRLCDSKASWDGMLSSILYQQEGEIPVPVALVLADPALFRNFVGVNIGEAVNCPNALIDVIRADSSKLNPLVASNPYYQFCEYIRDTQYAPPVRPQGFNFVDFLLLLLVPGIFFGLLLLLFYLVSSTFWRIFWMLPLSIGAGVCSYRIVDNYDEYFPYAGRLNSYKYEMQQFRENIATYEDIKDVHFI